MDNIILIFVLILIIGLAVFAVVRARKKGKKCIGCPYGGSCEACSARVSCHDQM